MVICNVVGTDGRGRSRVTVATVRRADRASGRPTASLPGAFSTALRGLLEAPERAATVIGVLPEAAHIGTGDPAIPLVCLATPRAVRLPCSIVVSALPEVEVGDVVWLGDGGLRLGGVVVRPARWWRPPTPVLSDVAAVRSRAPVLPPLRELNRSARPAQRVAGARFQRTVEGLLGLGPGLTPAGDDVLAAALVALRAAGSPLADDLASAVAAGRPDVRTTLVSAALLRHAAQGECIPELATVLRALDGRGNLDRALGALHAVGHTSGDALAAGLRFALVDLLEPGVQP